MPPFSMQKNLINFTISGFCQHDGSLSTKKVTLSLSLLSKFYLKSRTMQDIEGLLLLHSQILFYNWRTPLIEFKHVEISH